MNLVSSAVGTDDMKLLCPDCGGIIGATRVTDEGRPCTCFGTNIHDSDDPNDTAHAAMIMAPPAHTGDKVCWNCGVDVTGKKRYKDEKGYWCAACHRADKQKGNVTKVRCSECNRVVPEESLVDYAGVQICARCHKDRKELAKKQERYRHKTAMGEYKRLELRSVLIAGGIFVVLVLIIVLHQMGKLG